jgi:extracellular elastinolytic metalloproteinase
MVSFNKFFTSVYLAVVYASISVSAAPWETTSKHHTHREFTVGKRGLKITSYNPASEYTVSI